MKREPRNPTDAFTLMEVLVAVLVLGLAMVPVLFLFPSGARRTAFGEAQLSAHLKTRTLLAEAADMAIRTGFRDLPGADAPGGGAAGRVVFEPVRGYAGLWWLAAEVDWELPAEMGGGRRTYKSKRLIHRPEQGLTGDWPLSNPRGTP